MLILSRQVHLWASDTLRPHSVQQWKDGHFCPHRQIRIAPRRGFIRYPEVGRADRRRLRSEGQKRGAERGGVVAAQIAQLR